jgi:tRNA1(Val) A37 N6-methylase TrmN6
VPGPPPLVPGDRPDVWPQPGEDLCDLAGDWRILQRLHGHRWSLDDLVTAWVAADTMRDTPPARVADLGCGIGTVLLLLAWRFPGTRAVGVEAQALSVDLARRSIAWNGVATRCEVRHGDLRDASLLADGAPFDLVTGTPPYLSLGTATAPRREQCGPCHLEERGGIEDYARAAAGVLAEAGRFVVCAASTQHARVEGAAAVAGLSIASRLEVIPRAGKDALFSVYVMRRSGAGASCATPEAPPPLVVRTRDGERTPEFRALRDAMGMPP